VNDERANQGLDHLQAAALEMIHAARAFLDVAEDVVSDQHKVAEIVEVLGSVADAATRAARGEPLRGGRSGGGGSMSSTDVDGGGDDDPSSGGVQHIPVS
jgi:hypothetical protein